MRSVRIRPSLSQVQSVITDTLSVTRRLDPEKWSEADFKAVLERLDSLIDALRGFYALNRDEGDLAFIHAAALEIARIRGWLIQGFSPTVERRPSEREMKRLDDEGMSDLLHAALHS